MVTIHANILLNYGIMNHYEQNFVFVLMILVLNVLKKKIHPTYLLLCNPVVSLSPQIGWVPITVASTWTGTAYSVGYVDISMPPKCSKAWDMRYYWISDHVAQDQFEFFWIKAATMMLIISLNIIIQFIIKQYTWVVYIGGSHGWFTSIFFHVFLCIVHRSFLPKTPQSI
jgi:hypothetical protein